jgi:hypothetical protein
LENVCKKLFSSFSLYHSIQNNKLFTCKIGTSLDVKACLGLLKQYKIWTLVKSDVSLQVILLGLCKLSYLKSLGQVVVE